MPPEYISRGSAGSLVKVIQDLLNKKLELKEKEKLDLSGKFDSDTEKALKQFQQKNRLKPDGLCGPETSKKLNTPSTPDGTKLVKFAEKIAGTQAAEEAKEKEKEEKATDAKKAPPPMSFEEIVNQCAEMAATMLAQRPFLGSVGEKLLKESLIAYASKSNRNETESQIGELQKELGDKSQRNKALLKIATEMAHWSPLNFFDQWSSAKNVGELVYKKTQGIISKYDIDKDDFAEYVYNWRMGRRVNKLAVSAAQIVIKQTFGSYITGADMGDKMTSILVASSEFNKILIEEIEAYIKGHQQQA